LGAIPVTIFEITKNMAIIEDKDQVIFFLNIPFSNPSPQKIYLAEENKIVTTNLWLDQFFLNHVQTD
jgi:hypothetical protein